MRSFPLLTLKLIPLTLKEALLKSYRLLEIKNELVFYSPPHSHNGYAISKRALLEKKFDI
ncbi:hypothetical protein HMPREF1391_00507 [Helicobacter pylori GAM100Ai]|uniref:Uncharacterized protein n=1 Tax=Helicobacter pylori GAM100Ai TaxID=1159019 RepID=A0AB72ZVL4_HELPX|nr:hypothetical protein HMPREF1391_00507 [Helicobacter pylori GAM100Ai]